MAVVRRDWRLQAAGHPADRTRLGVGEERLDELCEVPGVIHAIAWRVTPEGRVKGSAQPAQKTPCGWCDS